MKRRSRGGPVGLKPAPRHAPRRLQSTADLRRLQRLMTHALVRPLAPGDCSPEGWGDGRSTAEVVEEFIKPNDRLTAVERVQIYHRVYWYRLQGAAIEDCPGLRALLGERKFDRMIEAYLAKYPSRSFTLRDLCSRLPQFLKEEPKWTRPRTAAALAVARFEWAQTVAFDGEGRPPLAAEEIARTPPAKLRPVLQPYVSLMELEYPVDTYVLAVKRRNALRGEASNTSETRPKGRAKGAGRPVLRRGRIHLAVHRYANRLYYKRLDRAEFQILCALRDGASVARALAAGGRGIRPREVQGWFSTWMKLGWLCRRKS